ncbi:MULTISPECIES: cytochrome c oxidase subunit 3 [Ensifer]|jgi:nitric oxide reductase NorE protein|uniref:Cytochrome c oxidase subunit 3 family protein n=1 Tax=Ensifer canadensis TaxID=555315 RepID=A0AAW4FIA3_9HYPH|nr:MULTISPECIES: cytochrome c oxidase subunit 3 [Ensifer]KQW50237.1 NorE accessory protein for nitric oxide reductase [Ensifer sp. Root1252]KQW67475.1 NorE accessory protein for nitric oxide reductase [Ensifer sp. Root127]KRC74461.1 NorE accessory protein for nitric oxide reductase [Ensifer sp. Root231]KRD03174.1 NorE accessory protein for nitric oxide reductase [Ensifer sp. Root258]MBD9489286.1 cytochrome c oxidase subunit 3 [Ensifer sp. ENS11]
MDGRALPVQDADENASADDLLLWVLVWSELAAFGILLVGFLVVGVIQADAFAAARSHLNPLLAGINTLVLLTSGWQAALATRPAASTPTRRRALVLAALFGFAFVAIKLFEYSTEVAVAGLPKFGAFFELYFLITGFHLLHVAFGSVILLLVAWRPSPGNIALITTLWHVIDLVWIVMFPIIYLA